MSEINNPLKLEEICKDLITKFFDKLKDGAKQVQKTDKLLLKPEFKELINYIQLLPKVTLQKLLKEYLEWEEIPQYEYGMCYMCDEYNTNSIPEMLFFIAVGVPVSMVCHFTFMSFPVADFLKTYSQNLSDMTLDLCQSTEKSSSIRAIFFCLKNLKELTIISFHGIIPYYLNIIEKESYLPCLKSLTVHLKGAVHKHTDKIIEKFLKILSHRTLTKFEYMCFGKTYFQVIRNENDLTIQELTVKRIKVLQNFLTAFFLLLKDDCTNITSLDVESNFCDQFSKIASLTKLQSLKLCKKYNYRKFSFPKWKNILSNFPGLKTLVLEDCNDVNIDDLADSNPLLKELSFFDCKFVTQTKWTNNFYHLKDLYFMESYCIESNDMLNVLSTSLFLRKFEIFGVYKYFLFIDEILICLKERLNYLEELILPGSKCTAKSFKNLLSNCKNLSVLQIGVLVIPNDEIDLIIEMCSSSSVSIKIDMLREVPNIMTFAEEISESGSSIYFDELLDL